MFLVLYRYLERFRSELLQMFPHENNRTIVRFMTLLHDAITDEDTDQIDQTEAMSLLALEISQKVTSDPIVQKRMVEQFDNMVVTLLNDFTAELDTMARRAKTRQIELQHHTCCTLSNHQSVVIPFPGPRRT